jgi:hypothetical protein
MIPWPYDNTRCTGITPSGPCQRAQDCMRRQSWPEISERSIAHYFFAMDGMDNCEFFVEVRRER